MKHTWAMAIDLDRCTGCGACVVACNAENNIPVIGETEAGKSRLMHWIRVNRYWEGEFPEAQAVYLPIPCMQCERAPCELVCPVYATYHNEDGLNAMVYNRCIGTRYCANNCPYSVRVFNWYDYKWAKPLDKQLSPDLTVRSRGVMEKCTFCIQRIRRAQGDRGRGRAGDPRRRSASRPAFRRAPPGRFVFGDLADPHSEITRKLKDPRRFRLMEHLGTEPRVVYLKRQKGRGR